MYPKKFRSFCFSIAAATFLVASATAHAQVNVRMTTADGDCVARTDAAGLRLVEGSTDLQASGVQLTGTGCQPQGGGNSNFAAIVTVPATATVPATFNVQWSASASATQCFYAGTSVTGWPIGTSACTQGCGGNHTQSVTLNTAGTYRFNVICTNDSGVGGGTTVATGGGGTPPSPDNFALTAPPSGTVGVPFAVSWTVANATSCTGRADRDGSSATLSGWTDVTDAASPRNANPTVAGTYTLSMTCSNGAGSVNSQQAVVVVAAGNGNDVCPSSPLTRQISGNIQYPPKVGTGQPTRQNADLTKWAEIWGHQTTTDTAVLWPGFNGASPVVTNFGRNSYIAAKFHVPSAPGLSDAFYRNISNYAGLDVTAAISTKCGDFQPEQTACISTAPPGDEGFGYWSVVVGTARYCKLELDTDYYLNIKHRDPTQANGNCAAGASTCRLHVSHR